MKLMTKLVLVACLSPMSPIAGYAFNGHNDITFDMTQKSIEKKGFICSPDKKNSNIKASCKHMELTGVVFGYPTKNYSLTIGTSGKVDIISAYINKNVSQVDYFNLRSNIISFFPVIDKKKSIISNSYASDEWRAENNAKAGLAFSSGTPPFIESSIMIYFRSPRYSAILDKKDLEAK